MLYAQAEYMYKAQVLDLHEKDTLQRIADTALERVRGESETQKRKREREEAYAR